MDDPTWGALNDPGDWEGFAIGSGRIYPPGFERPEEIDQGDRGGIYATMWSVTDDGEQIPIDVSEMGLITRSSGGAVPLSSNTISSSASDVGAGVARHLDHHLRRCPGVSPAPASRWPD